MKDLIFPMNYPVEKLLDKMEETRENFKKKNGKLLTEEEAVELFSSSNVLFVFSEFKNVSNAPPVHYVIYFVCSCWIC